MLILMSMNVLAHQMEIQEVRVYVDDNRELDADKSGGLITAYPEAQVKFQVKLKNNYLNYSINDVKMYLKIENIYSNDDNINKESSLFTLGINQERTTTISFDVPSDAGRDIFYTELKIVGSANESITEYIYYDLEIVKVDEETNPVKLLENFTTICSGLMNSYNYLNVTFDYADRYARCLKDKGIVEDLQAMYDKKNEEYNTCVNRNRDDNGLWESKLNNKTQELTNCLTEKSGMINNQECQNRVNQALTPYTQKNQSSGGNNNFVLLVAGGFVVYLIWKNKKRKETEYPSDGMPQQVG